MKRAILKIYHLFIGAIIIVCTFLLYPFAIVFLSKKKLMIITERPEEARDNGYTFFNFIRQNHPELKCYYAIKFKSPDYEKISLLGNVIKFGSIKHFFYFCGAKYIVSSTTQYFCPSYYLTLLRKHLHLRGKFIFLQHGITKDDLPFLYCKNTKIDLFICGGYPEYEWIRDKFDYKDKAVYTGFSRFDNYFNLKAKRQILIMPTWRRGIDDQNFTQSEYYKQWSLLLNDETFSNILKKNGYTAFFYIHPLFQKYSSSFTSKFNNIVICDFEKYDVQDLIKDSAILITDFSSIYFDYGYMRRPVIYYQFDEDKFFKTHYSKGYFDCRNNGFGPVVTKHDLLIREIETAMSKGIDNKFIINCEQFFKLYDDRNSERILDCILKS